MHLFGWRRWRNGRTRIGLVVLWIADSRLYGSSEKL
jgi:hypothetical protein